MNRFSRITPWLSRLILAFATFLFTMIGIRNLFNPVKANVIYKITLGSPEAITNTRVGFGAFPLGFAIILFVCLISTRRHLSGLLMLAALDGMATIARIYGLIADGTSTWTLHVLRPEIAILIFSLLAIFLEIRNRKNLGLTDN
jgi:hypothetical protein